MNIPIYCPSAWYDPAPRLLVNLRTHVGGRGMVTYTQRYLIKHRTDHLGGWYA